MIPVAQHDFADQIRHELSGMGKLTALTGNVLDNGYASATLVDVEATMDGYTIQCLTNADGSISYFRNGKDFTPPAPVSYRDPQDFACLVRSVIERVEADHAVRTAAMVRKDRWWGAGVIAMVLLVCVGALIAREPELVMLTFGVVLFGITIRPWAPRTDVFGTPLNRTDIDLDPFTTEEERELLNTGVVRLSSQEGVRFAGGVRGAVSGGVGYVLFNGTHPNYRGPWSFLINRSATTARYLRYCNERTFEHESIRQDAEEMADA